MNALPARRGFTLVELLVVTGLMASLLGLVVLGMQPSGSSQVRQLSQSLSSAILAAQTRALGNDVGAALILDVGGGSLPTSASNTVFQADVPPFILGGTAPPAAAYASGTNGMPPMFSGSLTLNATSSPVTLALTNADPADLADGYKIRFYSASPSTLPPSPWFQFSPAVSATSGTVSLRVDAGQTINNTCWPSVPPSGALQFQIARRPLKSSPALNTTKQAAIHLSFSGVGSGTWGSSTVGPIAIMFDRNGSLDAVMLLGTTPAPTVLAPTAPLYLLIATVADITGSSSLQSQTSRWLAINPGTGRINVSANIPIATSTPSQTDIDTARANARQGVTGGAK